MARRCGADAKRADLAALAQVELRRDRWVSVEVLRALCVVVQQKYPVSALDERRACIDAVELRDLIKESVDFEEADPFVAADVTLVAPADVVGAEAAVPVGRFMQHAPLREQQPVAKILVSLPASRVARDAADATGELEHVPAGREQAPRFFGQRIGRRRRRRGLIWRRRLGLRRGRRLNALRRRGRSAFARVCPTAGDRQRQDGRGHRQRTTEPQKKPSHTLRPYRMKNWPEG